MRHPWQVTLREFIEQVKRDYEVEADVLELEERGLFLVRGGLVYALPAIAEDDVLQPSLLRALCRVFDIPPVDFALDPEED